MAVLAECPVCHRKQSVKNRVCKGTRKKLEIPCETNLINEKKAGRVRYYIRYRHQGKQVTEYIGYSASEARDAEGALNVGTVSRWHLPASAVPMT